MEILERRSLPPLFIFLTSQIAEKKTSTVVPQRLHSALQKFICLIWLWVWKHLFWRMETNLYIAADSPSWRTDRLIECEIVESYVTLSVVQANEKSWKRIDTNRGFHQTLAGNNGTRKDSHHRWRQLNFYSGPNSRVLSRVKRRKKIKRQMREITSMTSL